MSPCAERSPQNWQALFLDLLPQMQRYVLLAFRRLNGDARDEAVQEALVSCCLACAHLVQGGKSDRVFPTVLAKFAVAQVRVGRQVATRMNVRDVCSPYAQKRKGIRVERLHRFDPQKNEWRESILEDHRTPVFDQVQFRIDFPDWLSQLSRRDRRLAEWLALGNATGQTARKFRISAGRVSQLRQEFYDSWREFLGEN